jgi:RNA polymerase sigma-70 factor, ECF subfamily
MATYEELREQHIELLEGMIPEDEDFRLVSLCQKGDLGAFEELVREHQKKMINIAFKMIGNYEEACDIAQDAFVSAYKNIKSFKGTSKFSTWLCTIIINLSKKRLKQLKTQRSRESVKMSDDQRFLEYPSNNIPADEILEKEETQKKIQLCLDRLEKEFREVVVLRDMQGFSYEEISKMLQIAEGTVKTRLFRARVLVKKLFKEIYGSNIDE